MHYILSWVADMGKQINTSASNSYVVSRRMLLNAASTLLIAGNLPRVEAAEAEPSFQSPPLLILPPADESLRKFSVNVEQKVLDDLHRRLKTSRLPTPETSTGWTQGVPLVNLEKLILHWSTSYDWRKFEKKINTHAQFRTLIDGVGIHFIHVQSKHKNALPIILTHGWPGSIIEFLDVIGPLTDPTAHGGSSSDAFHVVIPSLPGFGFSDKPSDTGWDVKRIAKAWGTLMNRLGYEHWVAQGGDWGSGVTHALGHLRPKGLIAAHVNWPLVFPEKMPDQPTPVEKAAMDAASAFLQKQSGYFLEQSTKPQTIAYALADSPSGQAAWIYEKFQSWSDNRGNPEDALPVDSMLDDITLYWVTNTGGSSARIYWENAQGTPSGFSAGKIDLPMAASIFPREIYRAPKVWAQALWPNMFYWNEVEKGGHFAAWEQPALFTEELRKAFSTVR